MKIEVKTEEARVLRRAIEIAYPQMQGWDKRHLWAIAKQLDAKDEMMQSVFPKTPGRDTVDLADT